VAPSAKPQAGGARWCRELLLSGSRIWEIIAGEAELIFTRVAGIVEFASTNYFRSYRGR
jgi:hypothetical protein